MKLGAKGIIGALVYLLFIGLILPGCQKLDTFEEKGMLESFTGMMRITPGISDDVLPEIITTGLMSFNSSGKEVVVADASGKAISLRDMLLKNASDEDKADFKDLLAIKGINPGDALAFSAFRGHVVEGTNGRLIKIDQFESATKGVKKINIQVKGFAELDKANKMYVKSTIRIFIDYDDFESNLPEFMPYFTFGNEDTPLDELDGIDVINIAQYVFEGVAMTGLI